ncbi:MAG: antA/AntB antirepressor family protein [Candidatus Azobacteroides sp.]|nr:antA/AntB antirepressor family protein [Candidatus Azobacteroides sp.]
MLNYSTTNAASVQELIPISEHDGKRAVSARMLHAFLESKQDFSNWIQNRIKKYGFIENLDFVRFNKIIETVGGRMIEYALSVDCAKEISMVEGNAKGKQARKYFIACEEKWKESAKPLTPAEMFLQNAQLMVEHDKRISQVENKLHVLEAKTATRPDYFTIVGYGTLHHISVNLKQASGLGRKATKLCTERNIQTDEIPDPRFGKVKMYPSSVLEEVFNQPIN